MHNAERRARLREYARKIIGPLAAEAARYHHEYQMRSMLEEFKGFGDAETNWAPDGEEGMHLAFDAWAVAAWMIAMEPTDAELDKKGVGSE